MGRLLSLLVACLALVSGSAALADVKVSFHSFNGSVLVGRYPHTFIVLEGELDDGTKVHENYGFSAKSVTPAILSGPVKHVIYVEKDKWIGKTNRHFTIAVDDAQYHAIVAEVARWRDAPGKYYDLDRRNCIHFVGTIAQMLGVKVDYPKDLLRKPRGWLNHVVAGNPQLGGKQF